MKISKFTATDVHGYLPIAIDFFDDLNFITGLNGSGKTTALRLLMALVTPNITELASTVFSNATVIITDNDKTIEISADKDEGGMNLRVSGIDIPLHFSRTDLQIISESKREEGRTQVRDIFKSADVYQKIHDLSTPMFLGLDRRLFTPGATNEEYDELRRREYMARRYWADENTVKDNIITASLVEINYLSVAKTQEISTAQEKLDEDLRREFFLNAFEYDPGGFLQSTPKVPSRNELEVYRRQLSQIEQAAEGEKIPIPEIREALTRFFERMVRVISALEKSSEKKGKAAKEKKTIGVPEFIDNQEFLEWVINKPQADRVIKNLSLLTKYIEDRKSLRSPILRFRNLVNEFLKQTGKEIHVAPNGQITVSIGDAQKNRPITALSSGERQLLVMLAHLSLNSQLTGSGVFIVDEPELSLHLDWQEKFVDAIQAANPDVQIILATHSPAIILDRTDVCISLTRGNPSPVEEIQRGF